MRNISEKSRLIMNTRRNFVNYADMTLSDGTVLHLTPSDFRLNGNSFTDEWTDGNSFTIGSAIGKTCTITLDNTDNRVEIIDGEEIKYPHGKFSEYDFYMSYFTLYIVLPDSDTRLRIGTFTVTEPESRGSLIEITGIDNMHMFDRSFDDCTLEFSNGVTLETVLNRCCSDCGVLQGYSSFNNSNLKVYEKPSGVTYRQVVSYIATIACCVAKISDMGALTLSWYDMSVFKDNWLDGGTFNKPGIEHYEDGDSADGGSFKPWTVGDIFDGGDFATPLDYHNLTAINNTAVSTDDVVITGVQVTYNDVTVHYPDTTGWDNYIIDITDNPFVSNHESFIAEFIYNQLADMKFRPFSCSSLQDPSIEAGDCVIVYDRKGNAYFSIITNVTYNIGGYTEISCNAESPISQNSRYSNPAKTVAKQEVNTYSSQVAKFNELANEALGFYQTNVVDEQGATITYLHDLPTLSDSKKVWKISSDGFAVTDDYNGDNTIWNAGFDISTGSMLMNLIYAHGISCDWIKAGTLTLGGENNVNGLCSVRNASGVEKVKLDKNGIIATGGTIGGIGIYDNKLSSYGGGMTGCEISPTSFGISFDNSRGSWSALEFKQGGGNSWQDCCTLWTGGNAGGGFHVTQGSPGEDIASFTAMKPNIFQIYESYLPVAYYDRTFYERGASDSRLKQDISKISQEESIEYIAQLKPISFRYNDKTGMNTDSVHSGFIAQDVIKLRGEDDGIIDVMCSGYYRLNYVEIIPHIVNVVNAQQSEINTLKQEIEELKSIVKNTKK